MHKDVLGGVAKRKEVRGGREARGREGGRLEAGKSVGKMWYGGPPEVRRLDSLSRQLKMY